MLSIQATAMLVLQLVFMTSLPTSSNAFVSSPSCPSSSALRVGMSFDEPTDNYYQLLQRANECAKDSECSLEEWDSVMTEMEYISVMETEELSSMVKGIHRLEERSALSPWINSKTLPIAVLMLLASTWSTLQEDEIVTRVGWFFQDWHQVATQSISHDQLPLICTAAAYVALSEVVSCFLPTTPEE